ncbi:hypothetical protein XENTR_v10022510 [Xenopus tropicalis]|nr:hypothetical protein XENTR_v10022510 [Xenopus tropicalis]
MAGILPLVFLIFSLGTSVVYSGSHTLKLYITKLTAPYPGLPDYLHMAYVDDLRYARYNKEINRCEYWIPALGAKWEPMTMQKNYMHNFEISHHQKTKLLTDLYNKTSVPPKVKVSSSESESGTKLHCRVYGFYPRDVEVKWIKNGRDEIHSEEAAQILPNPDGTYQIRVSVGVTPEGGATYSCHIDHSSLEKTLVVPFEYNNRSILYIIIPICAALLLLMIGLGLFLFKKGKKDPNGSYQSGSTETDIEN